MRFYGHAPNATRAEGLNSKCLLEFDLGRAFCQDYQAASATPVHDAEVP
jgi:hypothetical protein